MKKALAILMILALVGSAAFAEITFGAWGRGLFVPMYDSGVEGTDPQTANVVSWGGAPRIGFTISGVSDNVGFQADMNVDNGDGKGYVTLGDNQYIWVKPMSMVKISLGNFYDDTLRNNEAFGAFNWYRQTSIDIGESIAFSRLNEKRGAQQFAVAVTPNDATYLALSFVDVGKGNGGMKAQDVLFKNIQIAAGYTIAGTGQIKAQYLSNAKDDPESIDPKDMVADNAIEVAFKLTMVENLVAEAGFAMYLNDDVQSWTIGDVTGDGTVDDADALAVEGLKKFAITANYKMDAITLHMYLIDKMAKITAADETYNMFDLGVGAEYAMDGGITVEGDVRYNNLFGKDASDVYDATTTFFAGVNKGFSNGKIGAGFEYKNSTDASYAIPVKVEYWF